MFACSHVRRVENNLGPHRPESAFCHAISENAYILVVVGKQTGRYPNTPAPADAKFTQAASKVQITNECSRPPCRRPSARHIVFAPCRPLPADTLFTPKYLEHCDAVLAMYHDQGLREIQCGRRTESLLH